MEVVTEKPTTKAVPEGYKRTEVDVIPEDWGVRKIGEVSEVKIGRDLKKDHYADYSDSTYKYPVYSNTVADRGLYGYYDFSEYKGNSVTVIGRGVGLGTAFAREKSFGAIGRLIVIAPKPDIYFKYLAHYINEGLNLHQESSGIPQLTGVQIRKYYVIIPTLKEQRAIAEALSDVDALIAELDALIEKKQQIKKSAMQQLLTGKKRLPGFSGEWEEKKLWELLTVMHGKSQKSVASESGEYPILGTSGQIGKATTYLYDKPSVLIGRKGTIDRPQYMEEPFWTIDTLFYTQVNENAIAKFLYYKFLLIDWTSYNEASGVPSLNSTTIENIEVFFPDSIEEQKAIVVIINDMDAEIKALQAKRNKYDKIKQGMMQELLTGKTRLV
ncbi:MAG TPA: restriction endonuclease subunit S [Balneolaceae bacterium]|nr:restriction endonuclease subunit S [Balneolaceae bacterium]